MSKELPNNGKDCMNRAVQVRFREERGEIPLHYPISGSIRQLNTFALIISGKIYLPPKVDSS